LRGVGVLTRPLLKSIATSDAARQLRRAANGVGSNYRSAGLARSHAEFTSKIGVVLDESDECLYWLEHLFDTGAATGPEAEALWKEANELTKIFSKSYETANGKERARKSRLRPPSKRRRLRPDGPIVR
jgi:four helix bundle protein